MRNAIWVGGGITGMGEIPILGVRAKGLTSLIRKIFHSGAEGFAYDPNDLSTMYQDAAGTVPVTGAGQPVGLLLDKSKNLNTQDIARESFIASPNYPIVGTFTGTPTGYSASASNTCNPRFGILNTIKQYRRYVVEFTVTHNIPSGLDVWLSTSSGFSGAVRLLTNVGSGNYKVEFFSVNPLGTHISIVPAAMSDGQYINVSNFRLREVLGNHAYQTTSASRPILRKNAVTGANYLEFDGSDDFLKTNAIDFTATDKVSLFAGVRKLSTVEGMVLELSSTGATNNGVFYLASPAGPSFPNQVLFFNKGTIYSSAQNPDLPPPRDVVVSAKGDITNDTTLLRTNGLQFSSASNLGTGNYGNYPLYIGRRGGTSIPFNGHIYSLIGVGKLVSDNETIAIEKELAKRIGVTLNV